MTATTLRYFTSYSGAGLPLRLVGELAADDMRNRNTYYVGTFDSAERLVRCEKIVYGETEVCHEYDYHADGRLARATIADGSDDPSIIDYPA